MQQDKNNASMNAFTLESLHYDVPDFVSLQREDSDIQQVIDYKSSSGAEKGVVPAAYKAHVQKLFVDEEDNLLKFCYHGGQCIVMPTSLREEVLPLSHNEWTSGHFGIFKTHRRVLENFWWPGLHRDVCDFVSNCDVCIRVKRLGKRHGCMGQREWPKRPLDLVSIDYLVELPVTARRNIHMLVINDHFSKFIQVYPVKDGTAPTAAKCVLDYCLKFGFPWRLFSDRDPAFESELFQILMKELGVSKIRTTGYNPRSNGLTEQSNAIVKDYLTAYVNGKSSSRPDWDTWTRELAFAYNTSVHSSTGFTPVELMFGRKFRVPTDMLFGTFSRGKNFPLSIEQFSEQLSSMYELARQRMSTRQKVSASYHDKKIADDKLEPGELVYIYQPVKSRKKLEVKWDGQYKVVVAAHPVYHVEVNWKNVKTKCLTRDKLRRVGKKKLGGLNGTVAATPNNSNETISDRGNAQRERAAKPNDSGEAIPDRGSIQDQPSNSDETISDRGHVFDEVNFDSEDSDADEEVSEEEEDFQVEEGRGRGRYNLRPNPELARRHEGYLAHCLTVF
eukprot:Seg3512.1 transcript_id=Seg3512.1/GoldUCD/mRNA.D3Y31 product="Retrovirus-related Pol polyprotein from transposon 412" pseudo=true protein_id=Seg3512.1/GoldUCD/D3Y31